MASRASSQAPRPELSAAAAAWHLGAQRATYSRLFGRHQVGLYERGIAICRGSSALALPWENVRMYRSIASRSGFFVISRVRYRYRFCDLSGTSIWIGSRFLHLREWLPTVHSAVLSAQLPDAVAAAESGGVVEFGPVSLTAEEVRVRGKAAPWSDIKSVTIRQGYLAIRVHRGRSFSVALNRIPNDFVLLELARQLAPAVRVD